MRITLDVSNVTITTAELAKWCVEANGPAFNSIMENAKVSADDAQFAPIPINVETAIKYAFVAGVEQGWRNPR